MAVYIVPVAGPIQVRPKIASCPRFLQVSILYVLHGILSSTIFVRLTGHRLSRSDPNIQNKQDRSLNSPSNEYEYKYRLWLSVSSPLRRVPWRPASDQVHFPPFPYLYISLSMPRSYDSIIIVLLCAGNWKCPSEFLGKSHRRRRVSERVPCTYLCWDPGTDPTQNSMVCSLWVDSRIRHYF